MAECQCCLFNVCLLHLFGCAEPCLWLTGSSLSHARSFVVAHGLFSCGIWAELLPGVWDLSSLTRDQTRVLCIGRWILNPWTTREVPQSVIVS